jgi:transposase-like protein
MKYVKGLSEAEQRTLLEASRYAPWPRFRQRAHAVLLSGKRYSLTQLADIFEVDRDTVSGWLRAWEQHGLLGLRDPGARGAAPQGVRGRPSMAVRDNQRGASPASNLVRAVRGTNGRLPVARYGAALAERKRVEMETLPPQFERNSVTKRVFWKASGHWKPFTRMKRRGNWMCSTLTRAVLVPVRVCLTPGSPKAIPYAYPPMCRAGQTSSVF